METEKEKPNKLEVAANDYLFGKPFTRLDKIREQFEEEIRQAFYAGVQCGLSVQVYK